MNPSFDSSKKTQKKRNKRRWTNLKTNEPRRVIKWDTNAGR